MVACSVCYFFFFFHICSFVIIVHSVAAELTVSPRLGHQHVYSLPVWAAGASRLRYTPPRCFLCFLSRNRLVCSSSCVPLAGRERFLTLYGAGIVAGSLGSLAWKYVTAPELRFCGQRLVSHTPIFFASLFLCDADHFWFCCVLDHAPF
jgi:hypothetical protein